MNVIPNSIISETIIFLSMLADINIILLAVCLFLIKKNARFEVFWPQLHFLK